MEPPLSPAPDASGETTPAPLAPPDQSPGQAPAPRGKRPWTILGRLSQAVREQNWFAVVLEVVIVVVGVVIGFQVTGWGQAQSDRAKEQTYLRQLAEDLRETERIVALTDSALHATERAGYYLHRSFYELQPPPRDSILRWVVRSYTFQPVRPVLGTATALATTGDMNLIRDDSLRTAITAYADAMERVVEHQLHVLEDWDEAMETVSATVDGAEFAEESRLVFGTAILPDSVFSMMVPEGERRRPFAFDRDAFLASAESNRAVFEVLVQVTNMVGIRTQIAAQSAALREQVEAEIEP